MKSVKKHATGTEQLHAALAETDPTSIDLILLRPAGFHLAFRFLPLPLARGFTRRAPPEPAVRPGPDRAPAWRKRVFTRNKTTVPAV